MTLSLIRFGLLMIFLVGLGGTATELLLLGHTEELWQFVPLILLGLSALIVGWYIVSRSPAALRFFRWVMGLFMAAGIAGVVLHYLGNVENAFETVPDLAGIDLFWQAITGATPALAPGMMLLLGLIGWLFTFQHPRLSRKKPYNVDLQVHPSTER